MSQTWIGKIIVTLNDGLIIYDAVKGIFVGEPTDMSNYKLREPRTDYMALLQ